MMTQGTGLGAALLALRGSGVGRQMLHSAGQGLCCSPLARQDAGRIHLAGISGGNIDLQGSAVFERQVRSVGWSFGTVSLEQIKAQEKRTLVTHPLILLAVQSNFLYTGGWLVSAWK